MDMARQKPISITIPPDRAHAILTEQDGGFLVSIRAPISEREGADKLALQFDTGGGRAAAAG